MSNFIRFLVFSFSLCLFIVPAARTQEVVQRVVTNLDDDGEGSLRRALSTNGPAKIVFQKSGFILLKKPLELKGDHLTLDVASAPSGGVYLAGFGLKVTGSDFDVRNLRIWVGDRISDPDKSSDQDGILVLGSNSKPVKNGKILNCTIFAAVDEGISTYGPVSNLDIGRNILVWGLSKSHHKDVINFEGEDSSKNHHSMAILISPEAQNIRMVQNLIALNKHRNPRVMSGASLGFVNNVVYGWGQSVDDGLYLAEKKGVNQPIKVAFLANYYKAGPLSYAALSARPDLGSVFRLSHAKDYSVWDKGNKIVSSDGKRDISYTSTPREFVSDQTKLPTAEDFKILIPPKILSVQESYETVLANSGAFPLNRDVLENLTIKNVKSGIGNYIDSPKDLDVAYPY